MIFLILACIICTFKLGVSLDAHMARDTGAIPVPGCAYISTASVIYTNATVDIAYEPLKTLLLRSVACRLGDIRIVLRQLQNSLRSLHGQLLQSWLMIAALPDSIRASSSLEPLPLRDAC